MTRLTKMWHRPPSPISVPGYLQARSDDESPTSATFTSTESPQATVSTIAQNSAEKDINVRRSSTEVGIIIGALIAFGVISFSLLLLYRRRSDHSCNPLAWWRKRKTPAEPAEVEISDPMTTRGAVSDDESTLHDTYDNKLNESQQDLVPKTPEGQPKPTIVQKIQKALYGALNQALKKKSKQEPNPVDMEKGQSSDTLDEGISNKPNVSTSGDEWGRRPVSAADMSIQTESSMALHPAVTRLKSQKKSGPRPGVSAFSWSTTAPTSVPPIRASLGENPLPPLPSDRDSRRDTALTTMTEDSGPVRHMSVTGWVTNMQKRQQKREQRLQQPTSNDGEAALPTDLLAPAAVADPKGRQWTSKDTGSVRSSTITLETNAKTPALETATLAWHVHRGAGQVDVPPIPRSMGRRQNEEPESQNLNAKYREEAVYPQEEQYGQQYEYAQQDGAYSREVQYAQQDEYAYQGEHAQQADYSQQEQDYPQEHDPQQREDLQEQYEHQEQQDYSQQYSQREQEQQQEEYYQQQQYRHQDHDGTTPEIHINSPSEATAIPEEEWIPNITRYPSGTTTTTAGNGAAAGPSPRISLSSQREIK